MLMKKKILALVLCAAAAVTPVTVNAVSAGCGGSSVPAAVTAFEKISGAMVSYFSGVFGKIKGTNEADIKKAENNIPSPAAAPSGFIIDNPSLTLSAEKYRPVEIEFESRVSHADPFGDVTLDLILTGAGVRYTVPCFWDGGSTWRARFVCPEEGTWYFETKCSDSSDRGLDGITGRIDCSEYSGELDIYRHGFVTTQYCEKYLTYADGTPFFYLGDTHWSLGEETEDMVKTITAKRAAQGFTVIQSEPIGAAFDFADGITQDDIAGLASYDRKFETIADAGLVHANAEFFFPYSMHSLILNHGGYSAEKTSTGKNKISDEAKAYLEKAARYWVARYSAYPVLWTLGQETDNDFYESASGDYSWDSTNNPYILLAEYVRKYDCYSHPITAHQEYSGSTSALGSAADKKNRFNPGADPSAFINVKEHSWFAAQWTPSKTSQSKFGVEKDYWYNSYGKPVVNYEGQYCYLWTKNFGSRMQGWCSYLNGMYGYGWGGHDTWSYLNIYDEDNDSSDGVDTITAKEKQDATWEDALEYESTYQCGYMADFFASANWEKLIPRFDSKAYFVPCANVYYCFASSEDNSEGVVYFYSFTDKTIAEKTNTKLYGGMLTGTIGSLTPGKTYKYVWFNPLTGEYTPEQTFKASSLGTYFIGARMNENGSTETDMVFHFYG